MKKLSQTNNNKGFTLLEISIVLAIMGILMVGFLQGNLALLKKNRITGTKKKMAVIEKALMNHLLLNGNLPCPAGLTVLEGNASFGVEETTCAGTGIFTSGNFIGGAIPTATLNLNNEMMRDEWGNRFSYVVNINYTGAGTGFRLQNPTANAITVYTEGVSNAITTKAVYSIVSHGENGLGAYGYTSGVQGSTAGILTEETANLAGANGFNTTNVYTLYDENFDDIVRYKTKNQLIIDLDWEDVGCYIDSTIRNTNEPDSTCYDSATAPSSPLDYNREYEWAFNNPASTTECCIAKCYKYGRVGFYLKGSACD